jgi:hypothetical protein
MSEMQPAYDPAENAVAPTPAPPPPPEPPVNLIQNLAALRTTYIGIFNQILDNSLNINCICKTTKETTTPPPDTPKEKQTADERKLIFDQANSFMSDDDDDDEEDDSVVMTDENAAPVSAAAAITERQQSRINVGGISLADIKLTNLDIESDLLNTNNCKINKICDLSCFENMKYVHFTLKNCFHGPSLEENEANFNRVWHSFKFLAKYPKSCDYYGTTIYHYAASDSDDNLNLLRCTLQKYPVS